MSLLFPNKIRGKGLGVRFHTNLSIITATVIIAVSFMLNLYKLHEEVTALARREARASITKDIIYWDWNSMHGGVYVPVTYQTPPNQYLSHLPERDVVARDGKRLTLMNHAYMTRQVFSDTEKGMEVRDHITSLKPLNPENGPDPWERTALISFANGGHEASEVITVNNKSFMRLMLPLYTEAQCLQCHAHQGYKTGDVRGGISVTIPMRRYDAMMGQFRRAAGAGHLVVWLFCISLINFGGTRLRKKTEELEHSHDFTETVFNSVSDPTAIINPHTYEITKANKVFFDRYDRTRLGVVGRRCFEVLKGRNTECCADGLPCPVVEILLDESSVAQVHEHYDSDNKIIYTEVSAHPIWDEKGTLTGVVHISKNITQRKLLEESLREAKEKAEDATQAKSDFIAMVSHDIRTPIDAIISMTEQMLETKLTAVQRENLALVKQSADTMLSLLNGVLDLSKVEAGMLELENINFSPAEVVKSSVKLFQPLAENKGLMLTYRISPDVPRSVKGDPARIRQIINNLLSNAVKFTGEGEIEIAVVRDRIQFPGCTSSQIVDPVTLHFSVLDSGVGIPGDIKEKILRALHPGRHVDLAQVWRNGAWLNNQFKTGPTHEWAHMVGKRTGKGQCFPFYRAIQAC